MARSSYSTTQKAFGGADSRTRWAANYKIARLDRTPGALHDRFAAAGAGVIGAGGLVSVFFSNPLAAPLASRPGGLSPQVQTARETSGIAGGVSFSLRGAPRRPRVASASQSPLAASQTRALSDQVSSLHCAGIEQPLRWTIAVLPLSTIALVDFFCGRLHPHLTAGPSRVCLRT